MSQPPQAPRGSRIGPDAAATLRAAVREAGGVEVFAIGDVADGEIVSATVTCRGREDRVTALVDRPRAGQVVIHNHPSGDLRPSDADLHLASMYGENGVGVVIIDSDATRSNWVVEPWVPTVVKLDPAEVERFFREQIPEAVAGFEPRPQQVDMAKAVAVALSDNAPVVVEAGTGVGKSLGYLVPAALWALANDAKVIVSTHTKALQAQLVQSDLPVLKRAGLEVRTALLQGRSNYLCKRRLGAAVDDAGEDDGDAALLRELAAWDTTTADGSYGDLGFEVPGQLWDRVSSDADLTMRTRCPHYESCHYYQARRAAAGAHVVVVNHALLLADLGLRAEFGRGMLPKYTRVVLDEAHHLEDAATSTASEHVSASAIRRAALPLLDFRRRRGALNRLVQHHTGAGSRLPQASRQALAARAPDVAAAIDAVAAMAPSVANQLAEVALGEDDTPVRVTTALEETDGWRQDLVPMITHLAAEIEAVTEQLVGLEALFDDIQLDDAGAEVLLDVRRARRRLVGQAEVARRFLEPDDTSCRWIERDRTRRNERAASLSVAPIEVAGALRKVLWDPLPGVACTSATLTVAGNFNWWLHRTGLRQAHTESFPSPFDHERQAMLGLPRDLPPPEDPNFVHATAEAVRDAVRASDGGAFVLCTSYAAVRTYADALRASGDRQVLVQGEAGRPILLERFREDRRAVLVGTDSFWEGVSVKGDGLRLVIIPRLPFRVPTEPLRLARQERLQARGIDPFKAQALPETVLKMRQGYGRLIRSHTDTGVVLLLDRRVHDKAYGTVILRSLPPARRVTGPWRRVLEEVRAFFAPRR